MRINRKFFVKGIIITTIFLLPGYVILPIKNPIFTNINIRKTLIATFDGNSPEAFWTMFTGVMATVAAYIAYKTWRLETILVVHAIGNGYFNEI